MRSIRNLTRLLLPLLVLAALAALVVSGCTSSPTEPSGGNSGPITPKPPDPTIAYTVTVTASPEEITAGGDGSSTITVQVRRTDNGQPPPDLTKVTLTTNTGGFGTVGGPTTLELDLINGRAQAVLFPGTESGVATVRASATINNIQAAGSTNVRIGQQATFFVSSVEPSVGNSAGGQQVTILGGGFQSPLRVTFNGAAATVRSVTANRIVVTTPSAAAAGVPVGVGETATVNVAVTIRVNEPDMLTDTITRGFTYSSGGGGIEEPQIFSVDPSSGGNDGGTTVTIVGQGFVSPVQVLFGTGSATSFNGIQAEVLSVTSDRIVVRTPAANGFGQDLTNELVGILIRNVNTGFSTARPQLFRYGTNVEITAISQSSGPASGGTRMLIQGSGFDEPLTVSFDFASGPVAQQVVSVSGRQIVILTSPAPLPATCPAGGIIAVSGITVTNIETGDFDEANIGFNFLLDSPVINGINPGTGATGSTVVISGRDLNAGDSEVIFGDPTTGSTATIQGGSTDEALRVTVPNPPAGFTFQTRDCGTDGTQSIPTPINITVRDLDSRCVSTFRNGFLLTPPDGSCRETPPPPPDAPVAAFSFFVVDAAMHRVQFTDASTNNPTSWQWDFTNNGSFDSNLQNPQFSFPAAGTYAVRLQAANGGGSDDIVLQVIVP